MNILEGLLNKHCSLLVSL